MTKVMVIENRRKLFGNYAMVLLIFGPFLARQAWLLTRGDYFSLSGVPFSGMIIPIYGFFLSTLAAYLLLTTGVFGTAIYFLGYQGMISKFRSFRQIFSQMRLKT